MTRANSAEQTDLATALSLEVACGHHKVMPSLLSASGVGRQLGLPELFSTPQNVWPSNGEAVKVALCVGKCRDPAFG
jgi:hypothetical protein